MKRLTLTAAAALLLVALASTARAQIKLVPPPGPIEAGQIIDIEVEGLADADLKKSRATHFPREGVYFRPGRSWGGPPYITFAAKQPGKYLIAVAVARADVLDYAEVVIQVGEPEPPVPVVNPYRPDPELQKLMGPVTQLKLSRSDASKLALLFHRLAIDVSKASVTRSPNRSSPFDTCQGFADEMRRRGAPVGLKGKYPGLGQAVKTLFENVLGQAEGPLDRPKAARICETLAWAVWETGKR